MHGYDAYSNKVYKREILYKLYEREYLEPEPIVKYVPIYVCPCGNKSLEKYGHYCNYSETRVVIDTVTRTIETFKFFCKCGKEFDKKEELDDHSCEIVQKTVYRCRCNHEFENEGEFDHHICNSVLEEKKCIICEDKIRNVVLVPCGHAQTCYTCAEGCNRRCPTCRQEVTSIVKIFM